jgi:hypothetical protein
VRSGRRAAGPRGPRRATVARHTRRAGGRRRSRGRRGSRAGRGVGTASPGWPPAARDAHARRAASQTPTGARCTWSTWFRWLHEARFQACKWAEAVFQTQLARSPFVRRAENDGICGRSATRPRAYRRGYACRTAAGSAVRSADLRVGPAQAAWLCACTPRLTRWRRGRPDRRVGGFRALAARLRRRSDAEAATPLGGSRITTAARAGGPGRGDLRLETDTRWSSAGPAGTLDRRVERFED